MISESVMKFSSFAESVGKGGDLQAMASKLLAKLS